MAAFDFPPLPSNGQIYTQNGVTYRYSTTEGAWLGGPIANTGLWQPVDANLTALGALPDNAQGYPYFDGAGGASATIAATAAEYITGTAAKLLENDDVWGAAAEVSIAYATPLAPAMNTFINAVVPLITAGLTFNAPTNLVPGRSGVIRLTVTAGADVAAVWNAAYVFVAGSKPAILRVGDNLLFYYTANSKLYCSMGYGYA